jgi:hypothetical protein
MTSNEEVFAKADFEACQLEKNLGRKLSSDEYSEFVWWYIKNWQRPVDLRTPNPIESGTID